MPCCAGSALALNQCLSFGLGRTFFSMPCSSHQLPGAALLLLPAKLLEQHSPACGCKQPISPLPLNAASNSDRKRHFFKPEGSYSPACRYPWPASPPPSHRPAPRCFPARWFQLPNLESCDHRFVFKAFLFQPSPSRSCHVIGCNPRVTDFLLPHAAADPSAACFFHVGLCWCCSAARVSSLNVWTICQNVPLEFQPPFITYPVLKLGRRKKG